MVLVARAWPDIQEAVRAAIEEASHVAAQALRDGRRSQLYTSRARVRAAEAGLVCTFQGERLAEDAVRDQFLPSKLTLTKVREAVKYAQENGGDAVTLDGSFNIVHDTFDSDSEYEPLVAEWSVTVTRSEGE